jgi:hypothetical protein
MGVGEDDEAIRPDVGQTAMEFEASLAMDGVGVIC